MYFNLGMKYLAYFNYRTEKAKAAVLHKALQWPGANGQKEVQTVPKPNHTSAAQR